MTNGPGRLIALLGIVSLLGGLVASCARIRNDKPIPAACSLALDSAWTLACAIQDREKSRAIHQQRVAEACIAAGAPARALEMATSIGGWRAEMVEAAVAVTAARQGERRRADKILSGISTNEFGEEEWSSDYVRLRAAEARAYLARADHLDSLRAQYRQSRLYEAQSVAYGALGLLCAGDADGAIHLLSDSAVSGTFDNLAWHTEGFLLLADTGRLDPPRLDAVLNGATNSVMKVGGNRSLELWIRIADVAARQSSPAANNILEAATTAVLECRFPPHIKAPLVARLLRLWAKNRNPEKFKALDAIAAELVISDMISITERPALYGLIGEAYHANGQPERALDAFRKGFAETAGQVNPRPRAISGIDICLSMARSGFDARLVRKELTELLGTF